MEAKMISAHGTLNHWLEALIDLAQANPLSAFIAMFVVLAAVCYKIP